MTGIALICGVIAGWQARKYRDLPKKLMFWRRG